MEEIPVGSNNLGVLGARGGGQYEFKAPESGAVWVFRNLDAFSSPKVEVGKAYFETPSGFTYIRDVDLSLTNEQIAAQFGVNVSTAGEIHKSQSPSGSASKASNAPATSTSPTSAPNSAASQRGQGPQRPLSQVALLKAPKKLPARSAVTNPAGTWEGVMQVKVNGPEGNSVQEARFSFKLHRDGDKWGGEMRNYGNKERESYVPLNDVKVEGTAISFKLGQFAPGPDTPYYVGKLSEDGKNITGNLFFPQISAMRGLG